MLFTEKVSKDYFSSVVGSAYLHYDWKSHMYIKNEGFEKAIINEDTPVYEWFVEYFQDDELLISEWLYCQRKHLPFLIHMENSSGSERVLPVETGAELFDFLIIMKKNKEHTD